jgi:hypothetical protein
MSLIAHYLMNDSAANTTVADSLAAHNGTAARNTSLMSTTGKINQALAFNASTDLVAITGDLIGAGDFTLSCWFQSTGAGGGNYGTIISNSKFTICMGNSTTALWINSDNWVGAAVAVTIVSSTSYHLVVQRVAGIVAVWLNVALVVCGSTGTPAAGSTTYLGNWAAANRGWAGWLDDVRIYNHVLTAAEIVAIYNAGNGTEVDAPAITFPAVANVWTGTGTYGYTGAELTPTKVASSITNCSAGNILYNVAIGDVTGNVSLPNNNSPSASGDVTLVVSGMKFGAANAQTGTYQTTATTQAADASTLTAKTLNADGTDTTVTFGASNGTAKSGAVYTAGGTAQYVTDQASVTSVKAHLDSNYSACEIQGTLNIALYALLTDYSDPGKTNVLATHDYTYAGVSQTASLTLPGVGYVLTTAWGGPATYGVAGTGSTPTATLTAGANVVHTASTFGAGGTSITPTAGTEAEGYANGAADQYATDQDEVSAKAEYLVNTQTICEIAGTLDGSLYTLKSSVAAAGDVRNGISRYPGGTTGTLIVAGRASGPLTLAREIGANARFGSGTCAKLTPSSTSTAGHWHFYLPVEAATPITFSLWHKITAGFNGTLKVSIFDTDLVTPLNGSETVALVDDGDYHQYEATPVTPTSTGVCLVRIEAMQGTHAAADAIYIDDPWAEV